MLIGLNASGVIIMHIDFHSVAWLHSISWKANAMIGMLPTQLMKDIFSSECTNDLVQYNV